MTSFKKSLLAVAVMSTFGVANAAEYVGTQTYADGSSQSVNIITHSGGTFANITQYSAPTVDEYGYPVDGEAVAVDTVRMGRQANGSFIQANAARNGFTTYTAAEADQWRVSQAMSGTRGTFRIVAGVTLITYNSTSGAVYYAVQDGKIVGKTEDAAVAKAVTEALEKAEAEAQVAPEVKKDDHVAERTRKTNATVAGAIAINILIDELMGEELKKHGAGVGASVGGNFEKPELNIGASVDLAKHFGADFEGVSVNAGYSIESGELSVGARKSWKVAEYVQASVGASIGAQGVRVGPELMIGNSEFGFGVAMWGPLPIPQVKVFGYTASVVPHLALANAVVGGTTIAYKAIRAEMKKEVVAHEANH